jgi:outer membrane protein assembly factor BamB
MVWAEPRRRRPEQPDAWPKDGPKLLWNSDIIPSMGETARYGKGSDAAAGGVSSPIVSDGKVFLFVHWRHQVGKWLITTQMLKDLGWEEGVPDDLAKKIEAARLSDKRKGLSGEALDAYIKDFLAGVDPDLAKKFGEHITLRLTQGREALSWDKDFAHLAKARDKEFETFEEVAGAADGLLRTGSEGVSTPGSDKVLALFIRPLVRKFWHYTDTIVCLDAATGKELWKKEFPGEFPGTECQGMYLWGSSATPAVVNDRIYAAGSAGLYCLSVKDGAVVWQVKAVLGHSSPVVADGRVYIYEGNPEKAPRNEISFAFLGVGMLTAYSAEDGKLLWHQPKVRVTNGTVALWAHEGKNYLISGARGGPYCVDPATGDVLWEPPAGAPRVPGVWANNDTPIISGDIVVLASEPKMAFRMTPGKAELLWKIPGSGHDGNPLIYQDHAYFFQGGGGALCVELKTGIVKWKFFKGGHYIGGQSSAVLADGKIFSFPVGFQWYKPACIGMFKASPETFEELGRFPAWMSECTSPAIAGGRLYVRMTDHVACYDLAAK